MLLVTQIADSLEKPAITPRAAAVFRRPLPFASQARWSFATRVAPNDLLHHNLVLPVVAEIVDLQEAFGAATHDLCQGHRIFVNHNSSRLALDSFFDPTRVGLLIIRGKDGR